MKLSFFNLNLIKLKLQLHASSSSKTYLVNNSKKFFHYYNSQLKNFKSTKKNSSIFFVQKFHYTEEQIHDKAFKILNLNPTKKPTMKELERNYKKLAIKYHPDINPEKNAKQKFQELQL